MKSQREALDEAFDEAVNRAVEASASVAQWIASGHKPSENAKKKIAQTAKRLTDLA